MTYLIHAKHCDGGTRFRVWSPARKVYETKELSEADVRRWVIQTVVQAAINHYMNRIDFEMDSAKTDGTSSLQVADSRDLDGPWDQETSS